MSTYKILSLDGGGIRGLITSIMLERLEERNPGILSQVDLIAGTSTGGLLALGLASGLSPTQARSMYEDKGHIVFKDSIVGNILDAGNLIGAAYPIQPLRDELMLQFGGKRLKDLIKKVLISSFDLDNNPQNQESTRNWKAKFFHNFPGSDSDEDQSVVDVALRTANAPPISPYTRGISMGELSQIIPVCVR